MENQFEMIPKEKFAFVQSDQFLHDKKLQTKARSYLADALIRFRKNKSSVVAAFILGFLILFALFVPLLSPYTIDDRDPENRYVNYEPYIPSIAKLNWGIFDGSTTIESVKEADLKRYEAMGIESGMNPLIKMLDISGYDVKPTKNWVTGEITYENIPIYSASVNHYYLRGMENSITFSKKDMEAIIAWQNETGIRVVYPWVDLNDLGAKVSDDQTAPNVWYKITDEKGTPALDADGNFIPAYCTNKSLEAWEYTGKRVEGDDGSYIYAIGVNRGEDGNFSSCRARINYYNYYIYKMGHEPLYVFGTDNLCRDLFTAIGFGARFSLLFAVIVSLINLTIGAVYGAIMGYYGGKVDLIMDRVIDILDGMPFIVCCTLFTLHLQSDLENFFSTTFGISNMGTVTAFLLAFIATGWTGMAALTRKQFYRFKGQEYVMAARTLGASDKRLIFKHIFPNSLGTIITSCALVIPGVISSEMNLTYLNIIDLSDFAGTSIGELMNMGQQGSQYHPHALFFPALFVALLLICFNLFGNGLRDAFNPSNRGVDD